MLETKKITDTTPELDGVFNPMSLDEHEQVVFCYDRETGLKAIIAIHNTMLGPALGGCRMWTYKSESEALRDVLRLSRGMTYKAAVSGLNLGGGKAVIIGDSKTDKNEALFRKFGRFVNNLNGKYITAEDVGISTSDMEWIRMETEHVTGLPESMGGGGDPSPVTAYGVYLGMKASAKHAWGSEELSGKRVGVQGIGKVGKCLVELLVKDGAKVFITDINQHNVKQVSAFYKTDVVSPDEFYSTPMDIYAPCALGATLNNENIEKLNCDIVAGSANNQLAKEKIHGPLLMERNIVYAPDFLINAGGLINVYSELYGYNRQRAMDNTSRIYDVTLDILRKSKEENIPTYVAAKEIARNRILSIKNVRSTF